jgi:hypothetical protein
VWAVGEDDGQIFSQPVAQVWNGSGWSSMSPPLNFTTDRGFVGVSARSASNVWAVGWQDPPNGALAMHWNGTAWRTVATPVIGGPDQPILNSVAQLSSKNVWAVGGKVLGSLTGAPLVEHYTGSKWQVFSVPGTRTLTSVVAVSPANVWAVGAAGLVEHWDGAHWLAVTTPVGAAVTLSQITRVPGTTHLWAVGYRTRGSSESPVALYFNGSSWAEHDPPISAGRLMGVAADSATNVWVSGADESTATNITAHWNGASWTTAVPAGLANGEVENMTHAPNSTQLFAVGFLTDTSGPFAAYYH